MFTVNNLTSFQQTVARSRYYFFTFLAFLLYFYFIFFFALYMTRKVILLYFSMNYRDFSVKSKLIISLFETVKLSLPISLFQKIEFS